MKRFRPRPESVQQLERPPYPRPWVVLLRHMQGQGFEMRGTKIAADPNITIASKPQSNSLHKLKSDEQRVEAMAFYLNGDRVG